MCSRSSLGLSAIAAGAMLLPLCASGATITFQQGVNGYSGVQDNYMGNSSSAQNVNNGSSIYLLVSSEVKSSSSWATDHDLLRFDLSSLQGQVASVSSATLRLRYESGGQHFQGQTIDLYQISNANKGWTETGSTWNSMDGTNHWVGQAGLMKAGTDYVTSVTPPETSPAASFTAPAAGSSVPIYETITLPSWLIEQWINDPADNAGLLMRNAVETWTDSGGQVTPIAQTEFYSSNNTIVNNVDNHKNPLLTINYTPKPVPEPATGTLLLLCGGGLLALRKRKSHA